MKKLLFIALMLSFLVGNAQQDRQQFRPNTNNDPAQLYTDYDPGFPYASDLNKNKIRRTDNMGFPFEFDVNRYSIKKPDNTGYPSEIDLNRYSIRIPDNYPPGYPSEFDLNRYTIRKPN
jgi:hypothetical protein